MTRHRETESRIVTARHGTEKVEQDPEFEIGLSDFLRARYDSESLAALYGSYSAGEGAIDLLMRRAIWRALTHRFGHGVQISAGVGFKHPETFEIGNNVFIGAQSFVQGRHDGRCVIGDHIWLGPQSYFDARDLIIESHVGWGPGAKVLGSTHTGIPVDIPIIETDLEIKPVRIEAWADIGTNAVVLPGVTIGKASIVGAGAVVTRDVPPYAVVAGVPARFLHWRTGYVPTAGNEDGSP